MIILQVILILGILLYIVPGRYRLYDIVLYDASESVPANPLIGYAPSALETEACENTDLVFIEVRFSEWEPQEGIFDTASLEEKFHISEYKEKNKLAVLRFVCDVPGEEGHMDIPDWLYRKTKQDTRRIMQMRTLSKPIRRLWKLFPRGAGRTAL